MRARVSRDRLPAPGAAGTTWALLGAAAQRFGFPMPATARPDPSRMPCHWHCVLPRQGGDILQHAAGILLQSRCALRRPARSPLFRSGLFINCIKSKPCEWLKSSRAFGLLAKTFFGIRADGAFVGSNIVAWPACVGWVIHAAAITCPLRANILSRRRYLAEYRDATQG
jgi:hypothetical protein